MASLTMRSVNRWWTPSCQLRRALTWTEQAKILFGEAEENNLSDKVVNDRWYRWHDCSLCEQRYHGVVACALGWACWKTYLGRPETDQLRSMAMTALGNGLGEVGNDEEALSVQEAELSTMRRLRREGFGIPEDAILIVQANLAITYDALGRLEEALQMKRDVYSGRLRLSGEEHEATLNAADSYAMSLVGLKRFKEARSLLRKTIPAARRVLGESHELTLGMRWNYAKGLYMNPGATLDHLREAVTTLEEIEPTARRVLSGTHPLTVAFGDALRAARAVLRARETPPPS